MERIEFWRNEKTTGEGRQHGHDEQTAQRSAGKTVIVAQDTTELNYSMSI